jgi:hypothetical protein
MVMSSQSLADTVSGSMIRARTNGGGTANAITGAIDYSGSFTNFSGIQTAAANTGVGSSAQAGTSLAATAAISFAPR